MTRDENGQPTPAEYEAALRSFVPATWPLVPPQVTADEESHTPADTSATGAPLPADDVPANAVVDFSCLNKEGR